MARKKVIKAVVTEAELLHAKQVADAEGLTIGAYLRRCILLAPAPQKPTKQAA